eukprot:10912238-Lingulodinium_polyedra.AAC.1
MLPRRVFNAIGALILVRLEIHHCVLGNGKHELRDLVDAELIVQLDTVVAASRPIGRARRYP